MLFEIIGTLLPVAKLQRCKNGDCFVPRNYETSFTLLHSKLFLLAKHTLPQPIPYVLFFVEKKEPKKATVKRYTARLTDTSLCSYSTTLASAIKCTMHQTNHTKFTNAYLHKKDPLAECTVVQQLNSAERTKWAYIFRP